MTMETDFEKRHATAGNTELWRILKEKAAEENLSTSFLTAVGDVW